MKTLTKVLMYEEIPDIIAVVLVISVWLLVVQAMFQLQGLGNGKSRQRVRSCGRFRLNFIKINLKEENLQPGKINYNKIKSGLQALGKFIIIVSWEPPREEICPSSIAKYFFDSGYKIKVCIPNFTSNTSVTVKVPEVNFSNDNENNTIDFVEWIGMVSIDGVFEGSGLENYVTSYVTPEPDIGLGQIKYFKWKGLFTITKIQRLIDELIKYNDILSMPWISVYIQGFSDSPIAWDIEEHHYYTNGDNGYVIIFNKEKYLVCTQKCSKQYYK